MNRQQRRAQAAQQRKERHVEVKMVFTNGRSDLPSEETKDLPLEWDVLRVLRADEIGIQQLKMTDKYLLARLDRTGEIFALPRDREGDLWKETTREPRRIRAPIHIPSSPKGPS
jgi:hypothetical protein